MRLFNKSIVLSLLSFSTILIKLNCLEVNDDISFLKDFFRNRNVMITMNSCWSNNKIKIFLRDNMLSEKPKQIVVYKNISVNKLNDFYNHLSGSNWFLMDFRGCEINEEVLRVINNRQLFRYPLKYLILINKDQYHGFLILIQPFFILPMSNIIIACFEESLIRLYQPYKRGENESIIIENYGKWIRGNGMSVHNNYTVLDRRRNFHNYTIKISTVVNNIENIKKASGDDLIEFKENEPYFFQEIPNMLTLMAYLNASYEFRIFDSYGYLNRTTGKFNGMAADLFDEKSHISGTSLILSEERQKIIEFIKSYGYWSIKAKFILKKPSMSYVENIYYTTFAGRVWIASFVVLFIFAVVLYVVMNWEIKNMPGHVHTRYTVSDVTLLSLEAICQQGTFLDSKTYSGRTIILIMFTVFMFVFIAYSSYIVVLLQSTKPITSIRQLLDSRMECGGFNVTFMMAYYTLTKDEALTDLFRKKIYPNNFYSLKDGLKKVQDGNFAFQIVLGPAYNHILKEFTDYDICKLQELPGYMSDEMYISVPKTSQYKKLFRAGLVVIEERGLQNRVKNRVSFKPKCYNNAGNFQSVRIYDCYSVIILFALGVLLSLVVLLIENVIAKSTKNMKNG